MKYVLKILIVILILSCKTKDTAAQNTVVNESAKNLFSL